MRAYRLGWIGLVVLMMATGCRNVPQSGRRQVLLVPEQQEVTMGVEAYSEILETEQLSANREQIELVRRVGQRIAAAAGRPDYQWEFNLIASPEQNAFALPGGKVAVYEGILPICQNEAGLAVVMSHEVAHVLARHGGERMSHDMMVNQAEIAMAHVMRNHEDRRKDQVAQAFGLASQYGVMLPYSRKHETEADLIGLRLMARAGYDPREAPEFWQRFGAAKQGMSAPEFMSTHPSDDRRAADLQAMLTEVMPEYEQAAVQYGMGSPIPGAIGPPTSLTGAARPSGPTGRTSLSNNTTWSPNNTTRSPNNATWSPGNAPPAAPPTRQDISNLIPKFDNQSR